MARTLPDGGRAAAEGLPAGRLLLYQHHADVNFRGDLSASSKPVKRLDPAVPYAATRCIATPS
jgi:hypothetical protein